MQTQSEISLSQERCKTQTKDFCDEERKRRLRDSLVLCMNHLNTLGYVQSAEKIALEAGIGADRFELCDNMSLMRIIVDYEQFFEKKYGFRCKFAKPVPKGTAKPGSKSSIGYGNVLQTGVTSFQTDNGSGGDGASFGLNAFTNKPTSARDNGRPPAVARRKVQSKKDMKPEITSANPKKEGKPDNKKKDIHKKEPKGEFGDGNIDLSLGNGLSINATPISAPQMKNDEVINNNNSKAKKAGANNNNKDGNNGNPLDDTPFPEPAGYKLMEKVPPQLREDFGDLCGVIAREIFTDNTGVTWDDIVGLDGCKRVLREAVVMPLKFPKLFKDKKLLKPWRGVLLHGPPGTGKTLLAKAVASEGTTFFNISASTIVSKWRGDSEKLIRVLFELARYHAPSTIFMDELDSVMTRRSTHDEHEASRRMKTELLVQMDGLIQTDAQVFVLAASNFPFDLDPALLRRLEKRILVPLPEEEDRAEMFRTMLTPDIADSDLPFEDFAKRTKGYSGSDIHLVCKEAAMEPLRRLMNELQEEYGDAYLDIVHEDQLELGMITEEDVNTALSRTKASEAYNPKVYEDWQEKYGVV
ncbi:Katanin p60 ATPase-containing subunit A-like 2 [Tritrichomonas foetus]|uniref:Katanin p60 ATPase-containing subunit A-like 2 n=1 Tax=Tritrichomonas foetus TaxID=1144522 RepID=A0A1J4KQI9_9EUKA|nr:Katanin p60 ATPase-containing subunit A-like 2 [Tritrichomonas foetus]|eukprot:OHT13176.1 Katanin p60 ATPase-containing subunit A-like 2 [Tritrichomonas foetus]